LWNYLRVNETRLNHHLGGVQSLLVKRDLIAPAGIMTFLYVLSKIGIGLRV
jgi:hypothetical protein